MSKITIGNTAQIAFAQFRGRTVEGKVDTGATTSSLHAEQIEITQQGGGKVVRFVCPQLSSNVITLPLDGVQEVHSADAGGVERPIVSMDVTIDGHHIESATFNLNDRSGMDSQVLIGQNILQPGGFVVDPSLGNDHEDKQTRPDITEAVDKHRQIQDAIRVLSENDVSLSEIITYLRTEAVNNIKE